MKDYARIGKVNKAMYQGYIFASFVKFVGSSVWFNYCTFLLCEIAYIHSRAHYWYFKFTKLFSLDCVCQYQRINKVTKPIPNGCVEYAVCSG